MASRSYFGMSLASVLVAVAMTTPAAAQENLLGELYGIGVHSYYAGEYGESYSNLSAAIEGGSKDPRAYFFRGLVLTSLGRAEEAKADFEKGAMLEVSGGGEQYGIGKALERVQGTQRLTIERVRKIARIRYQQEQLAKSKQYYEENQIVEEPTLSNQPDPDATSKAVEGLVDPAAEVEGGDPFGGEGGLGVGEATEVAEPVDIGSGPDVSDPGAGDPFGTDEPAPPAGGDPFGTDEPAPPAGGDPFGGEEPAPAAGGDPFGGEEPAPPAGGDPFGGAEIAPPAGGEGGVVDAVIGGVGAAIEGAGAPDDRDPFDDTDEPKPDAPAIGGGDPLGGDEPAPPAGGDPFGGAEPAPPAGGDPFGGAEPAPPAGGDPFGGAEPAPPATPAPADPFGGAPDAPAGGDPFGAPDDAPAADDPFGAAPAPEVEEEDVGADPFGGPATPADGPVENAPSDDPFGGPAAPAGDDPFGAAPAGPKKDDPFGDDAGPDPFGGAAAEEGPADNAASDDPFAPAP